MDPRWVCGEGVAERRERGRGGTRDGVGGRGAAASEGVLSSRLGKTILAGFLWSFSEKGAWWYHRGREVLTQQLAGLRCLLNSVPLLSLCLVEKEVNMKHRYTLHHTVIVRSNLSTTICTSLSTTYGHIKGNDSRTQFSTPIIVGANRQFWGAERG